MPLVQIVCVGVSATDCSISTFHLSPKPSSNAEMPPTAGRPPPRLFGLHTVPRHRGPVETHGGKGSWGWLGDTVIHAGWCPPQGPGYLRRAPVAQVLCEPACSI